MLQKLNLNSYHALLALVILCSASAYASPPPSPLAFKLGAVAPLSGDFAEYGEQIQRAMTLAKESLEKEFPEVSLTLVYEDACLPAQAVSAAKKLATVDKINALVGSYCVIGMIPMAPILNEAKIPALHSSAVSDELLAVGGFISTTNIAIRDEARAAAEIAIQSLNTKRAGTFYISSQWGENYSKYFTQRFIELGGKPAATVETTKWTGDFRAELTRLRASNPDVLFVAHVGKEFSNVVRQARQIGIKAQILGPHEATEVDKEASEALEGTLLISPVHPRGSSSPMEEHYRTRFGTAPSVLSRNAYDASRIATRALVACRGESTCTQAKIIATSNFEGESGTFSIRQGRGASKQFETLQWQGGADLPVNLTNPPPPHH
jgi:branched-chain amino acid transport system substrate-binding protein